MTDQIDLPTDEPTVRSPSRRRFFAVSGVAVAGAAIAACSKDNKDAATTTTAADETSTTAAGAATDVELASFAAGLELLASNTYTAALKAATGGALGAVPPAVAEFAKTAQANHQAASEALAKAAGGITPKIPADLQKTVDDGFAQVKDIPGLAKFALNFELEAASTYIDVIPKLSSKAAIELAGSILPIERQHAAILYFVLGQYPVPETFATSEMSLAPKA